MPWKVHTMHLMNTATVHDRIREARLAAELEQSDAADLIGIDRTTYNRIESGKVQINTDRLLKIAEAFRASPSWLLTGDKPRRRKTA